MSCTLLWLCLCYIQESKRHLSGLSALGMNSMVQEITADTEQESPDDDSENSMSSNSTGTGQSINPDSLTDDLTSTSDKHKKMGACKLPRY